MNGLDKRICRIIKWLERCVAACRSGSYENALMDIECARADFERIREEFWQSLQTIRERKSGAIWSKISHVALTAAIVLLATAVPLATLEGRPQIAKAEEPMFFEWVTPDERELLSNVRRRLSETNVGMSVNEVPVESRKADISSAKTSRETVSRAQNSESSLKYNEIFSLVKLGEKVFRNEDPAVRIE